MLVHGRRRLECDSLPYLLGHTPGIVRGQRYVDLIVHVEPLRMVIGRLCVEGDASHERPRFAKVLELQRPREYVTLQGIAGNATR